MIENSRNNHQKCANFSVAPSRPEGAATNCEVPKNHEVPATVSPAAPPQRGSVQTAPIVLRGGMLKSGECWGRGESRGAGGRHSEILPQPAGRKIPGTDLQKSVTIYSKFTKSFDWKSEYNGNPGSVE